MFSRNLSLRRRTRRYVSDAMLMPAVNHFFSIGLFFPIGRVGKRENETISFHHEVRIPVSADPVSLGVMIR